MSLRLRLTLVVAVTFALVVVGCAYAAHVSAKNRLRAGDRRVPRSNGRRGSRDTQPDQFPDTGKDRDDGRGRGGGPALSDPDAVVQILDADGDVHSSIAGQPALPVDAARPRPRGQRRTIRGFATSR